MSFQNIVCLHFPRIDCFSQHLGFWWKGKHKYSTQLGAFFTFVIVIYFACFTVLYWIQHQEPGSQYYLKMEEQVDQANIIGDMSHSKQYIIAFGLQNIQNQIDYNDISYYNIKAKYFVENTNQDILERQLQGLNLPLFKCNEIQIEDDALQELKKLENYMCTDLANIDINQNDMLNHITIDFNICTPVNNQCKDPSKINSMLNDNLLTIYIPRIAISKNDRSTITTTIEKKYYSLYQNAQQKISFQLRSSRQESSQNILLYYQQKNSWLNMINQYQSVENQVNQPGGDIIIASIIIDYDQVIQDTYRVQNYEIIDFIVIIVSQTLFLYFFFSQVNSLNSQKNINKEINDRLLHSKEAETKLLLKLVSKAKEILANRKSVGNKLQPINDKKQDFEQYAEDNQISVKEKKDVIMNTDNFFQFDPNNIHNRSHEVINSNNVSFIPNYFGFELQNVIRPGRSSRYSIANHELGCNMKKKSTYDYQSTLQQFHQQKSNMQSVHNLNNRKTSNSIAKAQQQGMNSALIQQPRESITNAGRNSLLIPSPSLQNINSQINLQDQSGHIVANYPILNNNNFNNTLTERANTILSPQNIDSRGTALKHSFQKKDLELINDGDNITPLISEKQPNSTNRNSVSNLVKVDLKQIQKKDFSVNEDINNQDFENDVSQNYFQNNPNGGFHSLRSRQQSLFGASSLKKKQSFQLQGFNMFPQVNHQYGGAANFVNNRLPVINLNAVQQDNNNNIVNSIQNINNTNNNLQVNNCNCNIHNCNNNVNININNNITNMNQQNGLCITQARNSKIKFDNKSQIQKLEKVEEDNERDHEQSTKKRFSIQDLDFVYFCSLEKDNQDNKKQIQYPLLNEINLIKILEKLMELERLKNILLDSKQLAVFEYIVQSPIQKQDYFNQFFKNTNNTTNNNNNQVTQNLHNIGSFNTTSSSRDQVYFHEETIIRGWKAMVEIEKQKNKSDLDLRLINSINQNIYLLINLSNLDDVLQQSQEQKNNGNEMISNQLINFNQTVEQASLVPTRARGLADAIKQRNQRSLSESSCNRIIADENFNY
ncbi:transmembrane protein, putative (macronuclear) [Tetrahymena thermophila SB210]|uniref:Transmembrane protein, putative n=1 Tax=Tetrahymena thermophila (strain SB210) TaxID=312017 RepID=Q22B40_TETTS|nr:transmembrane protein, putative [Tetrahymena thermophila SB210]EAR82515.2 transmembrane protein, putative [Tetrahymena thermophila SB210]|eukprot:XP_001030178.2 transmembrane protein, putative [Tetrahymena thermophila SB210]